MFKLIPVALAALMLTSCAPLYARSVSVEFDDRPRRTVVVKKRQPRVVVVEQRPAVVVIQQQSKQPLPATRKNSSAVAVVAKARHPQEQRRVCYHGCASRFTQRNN
jgi:hypothetical protein